MARTAWYRYLLLLLASMAVTTCGGGSGGGGGGGAGGGGGPVSCGPATPIDPNGTANGALAPGDCTMAVLFPGSGDAGLVDLYEVTLPSKGTLTIRVGTIVLNSSLLLFSSLTQNPITVGNSGAPGLNAQIGANLSAGKYVLLVSTITSPISPATTGAYALALSFVPEIWTPTSTVGAPEGRRLHSAVWTGSEMIVWGGDNGNAIAKNTGGRFNPLTDTWTATATVGAPPARLSHMAVWTGTEMIVWGGLSGAFSFQVLGDGARYNPQTDTWSPITSVGAPTPRFNYTAVWTGAEMIVWGGSPCTGCSAQVDTGARYNPATDSWTPISTTAAPSARTNHSAVWTGSKMIVWGGDNNNDLLDTGGIYDPVSDGWTSTSQVGAPIPRAEHASAWTGSSMIVFGGRFSNSAGSTETGGIYDPASSGWTSTSIIGAPILSPPKTSSVWSGTELIVFGTGGGRYNPTSNSWAGISTSGAPSQISGHSIIWTGSAMIVWGGGPGVPPPNTGGIYDPSVDQTP